MSRAVTVTLTVPQAYALLAAIGYLAAGEADGWNVTAVTVLFRARGKIMAAIDA